MIDRQVMRGGITPAHAGPIEEKERLYSKIRDHPRTRGAHSKIVGDINCIRGSPPHTRGPCLCCLNSENSVGITPAHAGPICWSFISKNGKWDHPRTRGAHFNTTANFRLKAGSPPHTRGPWHNARLLVLVIGITPAHAGPIGYTITSRERLWDHPRTRGAHVLCIKGLRLWWGITPAHAGPIYSQRGERRRVRDHPRTRGAHSKA